MKIILIQDIEKLGKKLDLVEVKPGYARNFLIPRKLAILATKANLFQRENLLKKIEREKEKERERFEEIIKRIKEMEIKIPAKTGFKNELFEKITAEKIIKILKNQGIELEEENIKLEEPIAKIGKYEIPVEIKSEIITLKIEILPYQEISLKD